MARIDSPAWLKDQSSNKIRNSDSGHRRCNTNAPYQKSLSHCPISRFFPVSAQSLQRSPIPAAAPGSAATTGAGGGKGAVLRAETSRLFAGGVCSRTDEDILPLRERRDRTARTEHPR